MDITPSTSNLHEQAIDAALDSRWEEALKINKKIIKLDPQNIDALNRLSRAYMEMGRCNLAKKHYSQVIKIDPYNPIALKNLKIIKSFKPNGKSNGDGNQYIIMNCQGRLSPSLFLQEPGKTKVINLLKVAEPQKLSHAFCGMKVEMAIKYRKVTIVDSMGNYLGVLPDDISHHLLKLLKGGNKYDLYIKSVKVNSLAILIKEVFRSKRFKNQPSFPEYSSSTVSTNILTSLNNSSSDDMEEEEVEI